MLQTCTALALHSAFHKDASNMLLLGYVLQPHRCPFSQKSSAQLLLVRNGIALHEATSASTRTCIFSNTALHF